MSTMVAVKDVERDPLEEIPTLAEKPKTTLEFIQEARVSLIDFERMYQWDWTKQPCSKPSWTRSKEILLKAADLIETHGWIQGSEGNLDKGFCLAGATMAAAYGAAGHGDSAVYSSWELAEGQNLIGGGGLVRPQICWRQAIWNDDPRRTKGEVVTALRRLADGASWEEAIA